MRTRNSGTARGHADRTPGTVVDIPPRTWGDFIRQRYPVTVPDVSAEQEAVSIPILSLARDPYPPATTLTMEDTMQTNAKKNAILSKSETKCIMFRMNFQ